MGCAPTDDANDDKSLDELKGESFQGFLVDAKLSEDVRVTDPDSEIVITFFDSSPLALTVEFNGTMEVKFLSIWWELDGPFDTTIEDLVVEDGRFSGIFTYKDFDLMFEGRFSKDRQSIDLEVEMIGTLTLHSETDESA